MKKVLVLLAMILGVTNMYGFEAGGIRYSIYSTEAKVISKTPKYSGDIVIPETVDYEGETYSVTSIGSSAFKECKGLTSVTLPNTIISIYDSAFEGCSGLKSLDIPNSVTTIYDDAFCDCNGLTSLTIPNSVTSIGNYAFRGCASLTSITIPNSVTSIGYTAFARCSSLTSLTISNSITTIRDCTFSGCSRLTSLTIPNSITSIGKGAFSGCSSLTSIAIPNSVTVIDNEAFQDCSKLKYLELCDGNDEIFFRGNHAFANTSLEKIYVGRDVTYASSPFKNNYNLKEIILGETVTTIYESLFESCTALKSLTIPSNIIEIKNNAFSMSTEIEEIIICNSDNPLYLGKNAFGLSRNNSKLKTLYIGRNLNYTFGVYGDTTRPFYGAQMLEEVRISDNVTELNKYMFSPLPIKHIEIPNSVEAIGHGCFANCECLLSIVIPNSVKIIEDFAFEDCNNLQKIIIGKNVESIGSMAFDFSPDEISVLRKVVSLNKKPCPAGNAFRYYYSKSGLLSDSYLRAKDTLYVPKGSVELYRKADGWKNFYYIFEIDDSTSNIVKLDNTETNKPNSFFNVMGQFVTEPRKGIYIKNGKKEIIK